MNYSEQSKIYAKRFLGHSCGSSKKENLDYYAKNCVEDWDDVKDLFDQWMRGEASTKAVPFRLTGNGSSTRDDPFKPVKRVAEAELESTLMQYFRELADRIKEQVGTGEPA